MKHHKMCFLSAHRARYFWQNSPNSFISSKLADKDSNPDHKTPRIYQQDKMDSSKLDIPRQFQTVFFLANKSVRTQSEIAQDTRGTTSTKAERAHDLMWSSCDLAALIHYMLLTQRQPGGWATTSVCLHWVTRKMNKPTNEVKRHAWDHFHECGNGSHEAHALMWSSYDIAALTY